MFQSNAPDSSVHSIPVLFPIFINSSEWSINCQYHFCCDHRAMKWYQQILELSCHQARPPEVNEKHPCKECTSCPYCSLSHTRLCSPMGQLQYHSPHARLAVAEKPVAIPELVISDARFTHQWCMRMFYINQNTSVKWKFHSYLRFLYT